MPYNDEIILFCGLVVACKQMFDKTCTPETLVFSQAYHMCQHSKEAMQFNVCFFKSTLLQTRDTNSCKISWLILKHCN